MINSPWVPTASKGLKLSMLRPARDIQGDNYAPREIVDLFVAYYLNPRGLYNLSIADRVVSFVVRDWLSFLRDYNHFLYLASFDCMARDCQFPLYLYLPDYGAYTRVEPAHEMRGLSYLPLERLSFDEFLSRAATRPQYAYLSNQQ